MEKTQFEINFSDITILETDGKYDRIKELMLEDNGYRAEWVVRSHVTLTHSGGGCEFVISFWHDKDLRIMEYNTSEKDFFGNQDLMCLSTWAQGRGWNLPKVSEQLVKDKLKYWKYFWSVHLVDSEYLDKFYGDRENIMLDFEEMRPHDPM